MVGNEPVAFLTIEWGFNVLLMIVVGVGGWLMRRMTEQGAERAAQLNALAQRIVVLEERERGSAEQISSLKITIDRLADDVRFVREAIAVLLNRRRSTDGGD